MDSVIRLSALELASLIRRRELSPVEVVRAHIRRIEHVNRALNAVVVDRFERALEEARACEALLLRSPPEELPPLFGVPCTIKDFYAVEGMPQTGGIWMRRNETAREDAEVVRRVRAAGAIVLGVTNVPEGGLWLESDNRVYGRSNNPWDLGRTPGGSSGGEGAIIAAGGSPFGMGSDIGGSIRLPAAFCGVAGHKPTGRTVPNTGHFPELTGEHRAFLTCGPLARRVDDLAAVLRIVAGPDARTEGFVEKRTFGDVTQLDLRRIKVFPVEDSTVRAHPSLAAAVRSAARVLQGRGAHVEHLRPGLLKEATWIWGAMMSAEDGTSYAELVSGNPRLSVIRELAKIPFRRSRHTGPVLAMIAAERLFRALPERNSRRFIERGRELLEELSDTLGDRGVLLHPPYARPAPLHGRPLLRPLDFGFTAIFNVLELPATQVPTGLDAQGLPLGVQVVGARGNDQLCLGVARVIEDELGVITPVDPRPTARPEAPRH
jgi:fatty acid amide hydrolase 2